MALIYVKSTSGSLKRAKKPRKKLRGSWSNLPDWGDYRTADLPSTSDKVPGKVAPPTTIMSYKHQESKKVADAIEAKAKRIVPQYSKGPAQYITNNTSIKELGRKL